MNEETIGAVIIAKNEEKVIERCIRSVLTLDQVIVYDTGSTDDTVELAEAFGAPVRVVRQETELKPFHFARARNEAVHYATTKWILTIDCDEVLKAGSIEKIRKRLKKKEGAGAYRFSYKESAGDEGHTHYNTLRLYRNGYWFWKGRVHNILQPIAICETLDMAGVAMEHVPNMEKRKDRRDQSLQLLEMAIEEEPGRPRLRRYMAAELLLRGRPADAVKHMEIYNEETNENDIERSEGYCILGRALDRSGNLDDALKAFNQAAKIAPFRREAPYLGARALLIRHKWTEAIKWFERVVSIPISSKPGYHLNWDSVWGSMPDEAIAFCRQKAMEEKEKQAP